MTLTKSEQMSRVKAKNTHPEIVLRNALWSLGLRYRLHPSLPGRPDFVFNGRKIAIFVDGCFWHGCPIHYTAPRKNADFWKTKIAKNRDRDIKVTANLESLGWRVLRFWEHEIETDLHRVVEDVQRFLCMTTTHKI